VKKHWNIGHYFQSLKSNGDGEGKEEKKHLESNYGATCVYFFSRLTFPLCSLSNISAVIGTQTSGGWVFNPSETQLFRW